MVYKIEGWVMNDKVQYPCTECTELLVKDKMSSCAWAFHEFPCYPKCPGFMPETQAEGG